MQERTALEDQLTSIGRFERELEDQQMLIEMGEAEKDKKTIAEAEDALRKLKADFEPRDRQGAMSAIGTHLRQGEVLTGLLYLEDEAADLHGHLNTVQAPLNQLGAPELCPGSAALAKINQSLR